MLLIQATMLVDLLAMTITLWMAFYLFARGYPSRVSLRVVIVLFALAGFFYSAYYNIFVQIVGSAAWRAVFLTVGLASWFSLTFRLMPEEARKKLRWYENMIFLYAVLSIFLLLQPNTFIEEQGNALYVAHMTGGLPYIVYGSFQVVVSVCIMLNLLVGERIGLTQRGNYFLAASIFPTMSVIYGVISVRWSPASPRLVQDLMIFCGIFILGVSVARHQTLVERRTSLQDFPLTALTTLGLAAVTAFVALREDVPLRKMAMVVGFVLLIVGTYDIMREYLERLRTRRESEFRRQLRQLENESVNEQTLQRHLQKGLDLLCETLDAQGGFVAVRRGGNFVVTATRSSVPEGSEFSESMVACEDVSRPTIAELSSLAWIAPSFEGQTQVAVVALEMPTSRPEYSTGNLELLEEVADQIGTIVSLGNVQPKQSGLVRELVAESQASATELKSVSGKMMDAISAASDEEFIKIVEDALRHLTDTIALGGSPLAEKMLLNGGSQIERGKHLQGLLIQAIESLKPAETRPPEPLPRVWYNHAVLYDAYVECVPNREIMARLYISEGTFNRTRRNAIRGLARMLAGK
jgi:hypothetical protein